uniref:Uncharacterized protein n=1 Tax=Kryptolebias marmoratus TaxID=37003 RepID=A0A3Q3FGR6_KRYMA
FSYPPLPSCRRFTKNLLKPGSAAEIRQTACNAVRHSAAQDRRPSASTSCSLRGQERDADKHR